MTILHFRSLGLGLGQCCRLQQDFSILSLLKAGVARSNVPVARWWCLLLPAQLLLLPLLLLLICPHEQLLLSLAQHPRAGCSALLRSVLPMLLRLVVLDEQAVLLKVLPLIELEILELPLLVLTVGLLLVPLLPLLVLLVEPRRRAVGGT